MKKITKLSMMIFLTGLVSVFAGCPDSGTGGDAGTDGCTDDADCADGEACHDISGECVATCADDTDCDGDTPVCIPTDDASALTVEVCGCDNASCADGDVCNPVSGRCEIECDTTTASADECPLVGADQFACYINEDVDPDAYVCQPGCDADTDCPDAAPICDLTSGQCLGRCDGNETLKDVCDDATEICDVATGRCSAGCNGDVDCTVAGFGTCDLVSGICVADSCTPVGPSSTGMAPCTAEETCVFGNTCAPLCSDLDCLTDGDELCDSLGALPAGDNPDYNTCISADLETGWCDNAQFSPLALRTANGPVIYDVSYVSNNGAVAGSCTFDQVEYNVLVYAPNGLIETGGNDADLNLSLFSISTDGQTESYMNDFPVVGNAVGDTYEIGVKLCIQDVANTFAIVNVDANLVDGDTPTELSNIYCFESLIP